MFSSLKDLPLYWQKNKTRTSKNSNLSFPFFLLLLPQPLPQSQTGSQDHAGIKVAIFHLSFLSGASSMYLLCPAQYLQYGIRQINTVFPFVIWLCEMGLKVLV